MCRLSRLPLNEAPAARTGPLLIHVRVHITGQVESRGAVAAVVYRIWSGRRRSRTQLSLLTERPATARLAEGPNGVWRDKPPRQTQRKRTTESRTPPTRRIPRKNHANAPKLAHHSRRAWNSIFTRLSSSALMEFAAPRMLPGQQAWQPPPTGKVLRPAFSRTAVRRRAERRGGGSPPASGYAVPHSSSSLPISTGRGKVNPKRATPTLLPLEFFILSRRT